MISFGLFTVRAVDITIVSNHNRLRFLVSPPRLCKLLAPSRPTDQPSSSFASLADVSLPHHSPTQVPSSQICKSADPYAYTQPPPSPLTGLDRAWNITLQLNFFRFSWDAETRGTAMALFVITPFAGPSLGPIVGGYVSVAGLHWTWLFWILSIFSGLCYLVVLFGLPETYA